MQEALEAQRAALAATVPRRVPISWQGVASEVVLMGDFDNWSRGIELSAADIETENVFNTFTTVITLPPGTYRVKARARARFAASAAALGAPPTATSARRASRSSWGAAAHKPCSSAA